MINKSGESIEKMYKILTSDAKAAHGGSFDYTPYLPKYKWNKDFTSGYWIPGKWLEHKGDLEWCGAGFHLTSHPLRWLVKKGRVFIAEYQGEWLQRETGDKACFRKIRLTAELGIDSLDLDVKIFKLVMSGTDLRSANLRSANLRSADLSSADLSSADLSSADLRYADLRYADLRSADLRYADLRSADLSSADLRYADLRSADLSSALSLDGCHIDADPKIKGYKFDNGRLWKND